MSPDPASAPPRAHDLEICALCPKLCRHVCPVAVGTGREAAAPSNMALQPLRFLRGEAPLDLALGAASLCVACGACTRHCEQHRPLGEVLDRFVHGLRAPPPAAPPGPVEGEGKRVAVLTDARDWSGALAARLGEPVARLHTPDRLGAAHLAHPLAGPAHAEALRRRVGDRVLVVADHACLEAAQRAGLSVEHLARLAPPPGEGPAFHPCRGPHLDGPEAADTLACCGARAPLQEAHPDAAAQVAAALARRLDEGRGDAAVRCPDRGCARALRDAGLPVVDPVDALLAP